MKFTKLLIIIAALVALLLLSLLVKDVYFNGEMNESSSGGTVSEDTLLEYEWPQLQGDASAQSELHRLMHLAHAP